jgi:hypothetical protein
MFSRTVPASKAHFSRCRALVEIEMMRKIKQALDPKEILNPGRVLPSSDLPRTTINVSRAINRR